MPARLGRLIIISQQLFPAERMISAFLDPARLLPADDLQQNSPLRFRDRPIADDRPFKATEPAPAPFLIDRDGIGIDAYLYQCLRQIAAFPRPEYLHPEQVILEIMRVDGISPFLQNGLFPIHNSGMDKWANRI